MTIAEEREVANTTGDDRLTEDEIIAQCIIFFVGGFETTANTLTLMLYELAKDQDAQDKLVAEINESLGDLDANTPEYYDKVMRELPYLEAVMKETLRRYPPLPRATRKAGKDTEVNGIAIAEGTEVHLSIYALHHNPQNYQDPERWNPERFMPENKDQLTPYAYLPFGTGPRNCVGMRFAYQEIKFCMAKLLPQFRFTANEQTPAKIEFHRGRGNLAPVSSTVSVSKR